MREPLDEATVALVGALCKYSVDLIGASPAPLRQIRVYVGDIGVELAWPANVTAEAAWPAAPAHLPPPAAPRPEEAELPNPGHLFVCAPTLGTFYRSPEPGAPFFVELNDIVDAGQQLGILEAMKLMNPIQSEILCRIVAVLAEDGVSVEHGQPLFSVEPC
jgi:acetyl-CoA carboxylase biotin carboxyl carrier protein